MKKLLFTLLIIALTLPVYTQQTYRNLTLSRGIIVTTNSDTLNGQYIAISKDSVEYYPGNSRTRYTLGIDQVTEVQKYNGDYSTTGLWLGGIAGVAIGVAAALGTEETTTTGMFKETTIQIWPITVALALGLAAGYLIGSQIEDWDVVYRNNKTINNNLSINNCNLRGWVISYKVFF